MDTSYIETAARKLYRTRVAQGMQRAMETRCSARWRSFAQAAEQELIPRDGHRVQTKAACNMARLRREPRDCSHVSFSFVCCSSSWRKHVRQTSVGFMSLEATCCCCYCIRAAAATCCCCCCYYILLDAELLGTATVSAVAEAIHCTAPPHNRNEESHPKLTRHPRRCFRKGNHHQS